MFVLLMENLRRDKITSTMFQETVSEFVVQYDKPENTELLIPIKYILNGRKQWYMQTVHTKLLFFGPLALRPAR